jgi:hypothetical protein
MSRRKYFSLLNFMIHLNVGGKLEKKEKATTKSKK